MKIGVVNKSTRVTNEQVRAMVAACQIQMDTQVAVTWDRLPPPIIFYESEQPPVECPVIQLVDGLEDAPDALGYHTEGPDGTYWGLIGCSVILDNGGGILDGGTSGYGVASVLSHEIIELWGDEAVNVWADGPALPEGVSYAQELCDPVEATLYPIEVPGGPTVYVSDWVGPKWFDLMAPPGSFFSWAGVVTRPFELASGGYCVVRNAPGSERQIFHATAHPPAWRLAMKKTHGRTSRRMAAVLNTKLTADVIG